MGTAALVIGNFDGVHAGHRALLQAARRAAPGLPLIVVTFWPHPRSVLHPDNVSLLLTGLEDRIHLLKQAGADAVKVVNFTPEFARLSPEDFVTGILVPLDPDVVVVGENFRFGRQAAGDVGTLTRLGQGRFRVEVLPLLWVEDEETCSTHIRQALEEGDVEQAARLLGRPFTFSGLVVDGDHRGRTLGYPTANLPVPKGFACPADGVYAGWVTRLDGRDGYGRTLSSGTAAARWPAAISVGSNPTFAGVSRRVEAHVLGLVDLQLYDAPILVEFVARVRPMVKFGSVAELLAQLAADVTRIRSLLATDVVPAGPESE